MVLHYHPELNIFLISRFAILKLAHWMIILGYASYMEDIWEKQFGLGFPWTVILWSC